MTRPIITACLLGLCAASSCAQQEAGQPQGDAPRTGQADRRGPANAAAQKAAPGTAAGKKEALLPDVPLPKADARGEAIPAATGANVDESRVQKTYHVALTGGDGAPGTPAQPMKSLAAALQAAFADKARGVGVKVVIGPGVYREAMGAYKGDWNPKQPDKMGAPLVVEAAQPGQTIICGSDVWTNWQPAGEGKFSHPTAMTWDIQKKPLRGSYPLITRRQEMVHVNGQRLAPVLEAADLKPGTFFVPVNADGTQGIGPVTMMPPAGTDVARATVEVTTRPQALELLNQSNLVLRGLRFEKIGGLNRGGAVIIDYARNVLLDNCRFNGNSSRGFRGGGGNVRTREYSRDVTPGPFAHKARQNKGNNP